MKPQAGATLAIGQRGAKSQTRQGRGRRAGVASANDSQRRGWAWSCLETQSSAMKLGWLQLLFAVHGSVF